LKVSLFDIADPAAPKEISTLLLGSRGSYSDLNNNHKALLADPNVNILAFPALLAKTSSSSPLEYGQPYFQGLVVMSIVNDRIQLLGGISHDDRNRGLDDSGISSTEDDMNRFYGYDQVLRGAFIGDVLYTLSSHKIQASRMNDLQAIGSVELPGYDDQNILWGVTEVR
jgi:inhibitor of cysteine peptidase